MVESLRQVLAAMYLADRYAAGPVSLSKANQLLLVIADNPQTDAEAARMLRILVAQSNNLCFPASATAH
jgi:hypothetical protein